MEQWHVDLLKVLLIVYIYSGIYIGNRIDNIVLQLCML